MKFKELKMIHILIDGSCFLVLSSLFLTVIYPLFQQFDVLMPTGDDEGILRGGPLSEKYQILQLHFHWGKDDTKGSEHTYDNKAFPLEMHVVHVKSSLKDDLPKALSTSDGLAVTGFQFEIGVMQ